MKNDIVQDKNFTIEYIKSNYASDFCEKLAKWVNDFDSTLDVNHEVGVCLVSFGKTLTFHLQDIGYWNPSLVLLRGEADNGDPVELIQHVNQISILLMKVARKSPEQPKRQIGFQKYEPHQNPRK